MEIQVEVRIPAEHGVAKKPFILCLLPISVLLLAFKQVGDNCTLLYFLPAAKPSGHRTVRVVVVVVVVVGGGLL